MTCNAKRVGDQMLCGPCGLQWDMNDPEPPKCKGLNGGRSAVLRQVNKLEAAAQSGIIDLVAIVNHVAGRTLSRADFAMCKEIAKQAFKAGQESVK